MELYVMHRWRSGADDSCPQGSLSQQLEHKLEVTPSLVSVGDDRQGSLGTASSKYDRFDNSTRINVTVNERRLTFLKTLISIAFGVVCNGQIEVVGTDFMFPQGSLSLLEPWSWRFCFSGSYFNFGIKRGLLLRIIGNSKFNVWWTR